MPVKTGRNDPCPCGSGKKYKHCCLVAAVSSHDSAWRQQRDASGRLTQEMLRFVSRRFAEDIQDAWLDFNQDDSPIPVKEDVAEGQIFVPYFLFDWDPERRSRRRASQPPGGLVARSYLLDVGRRLPELERLILNQAITQPVSFYEVVGCQPGERVVLRDVLIGGETEVMERTASQTLRPGDLVYGQMCVLPEVTSLGRLAPLPIAPGNKVSIVKLRAKLRKKIAKQNRELTAADLVRYEEEIRTTYLDVRDAMRTPPRLANTDGDPIILHSLTFRTGSAHAAFEALAPLAWGFSKEQLLQNAETDDEGALRSVEIPWIKKGNRRFQDWETTIHGHIKISGRSLVVEVNSEKRATKIRQEIERRLGILVVHQRTVTQTPEAMLKKKDQRKPARGPASEVESNIPSLDPEVAKQMEAEVQRQMENWIHLKVPALGGRTPLEAVADPDGKEIVESLLLDFERRSEEMQGSGIFYPDIKAIRRLLNLDPSVA